MAVRHGAELVVIIEDDAPVPGNAEVLQQQVAGEYVRIGEVADTLSIDEYRPLGCGFGRISQVEVARSRAPLDVQMIAREIGAVLSLGHGRFSEQLLQ